MTIFLQTEQGDLINLEQVGQVCVMTNETITALDIHDKVLMDIYEGRDTEECALYMEWLGRELSLGGEGHAILHADFEKYRTIQKKATTLKRPTVEEQANTDIALQLKVMEAVMHHKRISQFDLERVLAHAMKPERLQGALNVLETAGQIEKVAEEDKIFYGDDGNVYQLAGEDEDAGEDA